MRRRFRLCRGRLLLVSLAPAILLIAARLSPDKVSASHNPGRDCLACHVSFRAAGTVFADASGTTTAPGTSVAFSDGAGTVLTSAANAAGNLAVSSIPDGRYLVRVGAVTGRTWHLIPAQGSCNTCHAPGGNGSADRIKTLHPYHTRIPEDNDCRHCHHFPASQSYGSLKTPGVLNAAAAAPAVPKSRVDILGRVFDFDPAVDGPAATLRPDIFAPGYFSAFDALLAVARRNGIRIDYRFDPACMTYFIKSVDGRLADFWYRFSYDTGGGNAGELNNRRANRWDEVLWRPGVWVKLTEGESLAEIKSEYREEIARERTMGHVVPLVRVSVNPSGYKGNPPGSGRITVSRDFTNVRVEAHDRRGEGTPAPYARPFRPGVVTSLDILLSLKDQGFLDLVTGAFYTYFAGNFIDSHYVVALGFPGLGTAHASGRQGFVYTTENGSPSRLPNNAASTLHILSDIHVIHAPDFSQWRWAELGNPYYESLEMGGEAGLAASIDEDHRAIERGFNLYPIEEDGAIRFNVFMPGRYEIAVKDEAGRTLARLWDGPYRTSASGRSNPDGGTCRPEPPPWS